MHVTASKIQTLADVELAVLLCLVAHQHCIISAHTLLLDSLAQELQLVCPVLAIIHLHNTNSIKIATNVFGLSYALVDCSPTTTLDDFKQSVLLNVPNSSNQHGTSSHTHLPLPSFKHTNSTYTGTSNELDERKIADMIIAKNLNTAHTNVQTQALEVTFSYKYSTVLAI
jgi:hypothetical protein